MTPARHAASDVCLVVASHDGCADVWPAFFGQLFRLWPDMPYPLYLISNHLAFADPRVTALRVGDDLSWSQTLARGLEGLSSRFVLLMLEDFFLTAPVDTARVGRMHDAMVAKGAACLRLAPYPEPDAPCPDNPAIGVIEKGTPYRVSLQAAFWDRRLLLGLLRREESAWDFEVNGSRRSAAMSEPFLSVCEGAAALPYRHVLRRGKLLPAAVRHFASLGMSFDLSKRSFESELYLKWQYSALRRFLGSAWRLVTRRPL